MSPRRDTRGSGDRARRTGRDRATRSTGASRPTKRTRSTAAKAGASKARKNAEPKAASRNGPSKRRRGATTRPQAEPAVPRDARARRSFRLRAGVAGLAAIAFLFVFVFPTSSLWEQRRDIRETRERVDLVRAEADRLEWELARLGDDEVVTRLARERFHLVRPGETAWAVVPGPVTTPAAAAQPDSAAETDAGADTDPATGTDTDGETDAAAEPGSEAPPLVP